MVFVSLVNISLDITANITWWIMKNSVYGTYYIVTYFMPPMPTKEEIELLELRNEISSLNKKLHLINSINNNAHIITREQLLNDVEKEFEMIDDF